MARPTGRGFHTPKTSRHLPKIPVHNSATIKAALPNISASFGNRTGEAPISGNLSASYPKIRGFNSGPGGSIQQPFVTSTGINGYY